MDDETIYGPRAYTLTFGSAARQGIICNYKVVISVVDGQEINDFALKHGITLVEGDLIRARRVANQIAIERAIEKTGAKRAISFHSRVSSAEEFNTDGARGIKQFLPEFCVFHVNGEQKSSERKQLIHAFRDASKALITNARCLTEGIDVPAVDMVAFIDPRRSKLDIAQATGRAMRKPQGSDKEIGYVVIPLFLGRNSGETLEEALKRSNFSDVANVLNAMQEQDEDLVQIIRELQEAKGRSELFDPKRLSEKIEVIGPTIELSALRSSIFAETVNTIGVSWDEMFGRLLLFRDKHEHCRVPWKYVDRKLAHWVGNQRQFGNKGTLSTLRKQRLDRIGFDWDAVETDWQQGFDQLVIYKEREGHCRVPHMYKEDGFRLGAWVNKQRFNDTMPAERRRKLDEIGFIWDVLEEDWNEGFNYLNIFKNREGHCRVPKDHIENGFRLGVWVANHRAKRAVLFDERRQRLDGLGFVWELFGTLWEGAFERLSNYKTREGHCLVPVDYEENGFPLGRWVFRQRQNKKRISIERQRRLNTLGFVWRPFDSAWERSFAALIEFKNREGHCRVPQDHIEDGINLGRWVSKQRAKKNLSVERRQFLDALGFVWNVQAPRRAKCRA